MKNFKKVICLVVTLVLVLSIGVSTFAYIKGAYETTLKVVINKVGVVVDGKNIVSENDQSKLNTILYDGTTYVPLRKVSENMGCKVEYDSNTHIANITSNTSDIKLEGMKIGKCIEKYQEGEFITCRFEINNNREKEYCITYTNKFEVGKSYGVLGNHWIIDSEGYEHEIETFELYGWNN